MDGIRKHFRRLESWVRAPSATTQRGPHFQYMSDLHLEVGQQYLTFDFDVTAPNLILAGDIGRLIDYEGYVSFLQKQTTRYTRVFLVLGNHEFYDLSFETGLARARALEKEPVFEGKLILLQRNAFVFGDEGVVIIGCPLWSFIPGDSAPKVASVLNDFKRIEGWTIEKHNFNHAEDLSWLRDQVQHHKADTRILVVTHHAPLVGKTASPQHKNSLIKSAFATDVLLDTRDSTWSPVKYWIFGHTHWTTQFKLKGIQVVSNQRGYVFPGKNARLVADTQEPSHTFDANRVIQP
ncbi:hypothetical protein Daus18300_000148 [Diaporthe australafricana]|uniref:Calcineurin-like phosphoesterase domain-containing protein n=1 Tax=Diaporthe australafricana TaxID=127596 RepID=A0ABR3Y7N5_9PEZI